MRKLVKASLGENTANIIRERIITGEYPAGMKLKEDELSNEFEISRICVREALLILDREGLIDKNANKTPCVRVYTAKDVEDLLEYRVMLETAAAVGCVRNNSIPEDQLLKCIDDMRRLHEGVMTSEEYLEADILFHDTIIRSFGNDYFNISWNTVRSQYLTLMFALYKLRGTEFSSGFQAHQKILDMMKKGDIEELSGFINQHVMSNCDSVSQFVCEE